MTIKNLEKLPKEIVGLLEKHVEILLNVLGEKLVGVYVHGSAAMADFTFEQSDVDYLAVISALLAADEREKLASSFLEIYGKDSPGNGVEMSIVETRFASDRFRYPTPYEFHMGTKEQIKFHSLPHKSEMTDPDLAAHFTTARERGVCIYGQPIGEVFSEIPKKVYLASIAQDSEESFNNIQGKTVAEKCVVPQYAVLSFCRVLAFVNHGLITTKTEAGEWALKNLPDKYHPIIEAGLSERRQRDSSQEVDSQLLKAFAMYAQEKIRDKLPGS